MELMVDFITGAAGSIYTSWVHVLSTWVFILMQNQFNEKTQNLLKKRAQGAKWYLGEATLHECKRKGQ